MARPRLPVPVGEKFGRLTVLGPAPSLKNSKGRMESVWLCRCDCGSEKAVRSTDLRHKGTSSCGCLNTGPVRHGLHDHPLYPTWVTMRYRCRTPSCHAWKDYGGRGITFCEGWDSFENFLADIGEKPGWATGGIDRIDNDGGYWCGHCEECEREGHPPNHRWATREQQAQNRRKPKRKAAS